MKRKEIIRNFHRVREIERRKEFMDKNNIPYQRDEFNNYVIHADDGTLQLFPIV